MQVEFRPEDHGIFAIRLAEGSRQVDQKIEVFGASWCPDCKRAKQFLGDQRIAFEWHDVELEPQGLEIVREHNNGNDVIPTVVFPDGTILSEPSNEELANKIGLDRKAMRHVYDLVLVGGGPAALTTSIYASREDLSVLIIDSKGLGGQAGVTERLDNYPGFPDGIGGAELAERGQPYPRVDKAFSSGKLKRSPSPGRTERQRP